MNAESELNRYLCTLLSLAADYSSHLPSFSHTQTHERGGAVQISREHAQRGKIKITVESYHSSSPLRLRENQQTSCETIKVDLPKLYIYFKYQRFNKQKIITICD